ncbi:alpha-glucosidase [Pyrenophora tritici-repentis]|uniref:Alpha-glucosidase n=1 Tax=Pyrenophora tritici-repentis TaxID=45151 RepID=A0A5M9LN80_9PLEO|nr:alpha-glucosidase [Pyrenophora tritici-repentis]KAF7578566.1 alpha-glucosidase [Pyrenophora tritici-repentis]KAG9389125.1 alpha-glucosidase [Pyrenophora tritici-repentis]KAI0575449.1 alpha-glucosidase [Pyrenophora tritici-repentis]KAI1673493.1 catalytic domain containing protein [Pyrenophora tritici-repentis]
MSKLDVIKTERLWWKESVVYQIYPASFRDANNDGHGDVRGIIESLDYLKNLGVDVIWLSPIYKSPQVDMGYDISDYKDIDPKYGTLADVDELIAKLGVRDMKLMMDLVVNHTSNQHPWFLESRSSTDNPKRDWYIWKKGKLDKDGKPGPPNNWCRILDTTESAWNWNENRQEYFLSLFSPEQPDLNWESEEVRAAVHDIIRFWLDRGVRGFRMDVIDHISKVQDFPDAEETIPGQKLQPGNVFYANGPRLSEYLHEIRQVLNEYDTITVGEMPFINDEDEIISTVGLQGSLNMLFLFKILNVDNQPGRSKWSYQEWDATDMARIHERTQRLMIERDGWNAIFCENHDTPRSVSRFADDSEEWRDYAAKMICTKHTTLGGTEYIYQGEELGMRNIPADWPITEYKDIETQNYWKAASKQYANNWRKLEYARKMIQLKARDHTRTPMQWDSTPNAGFCKEDVKPWMRVNDDYPRVNVLAQLDNPLSVFSYWKQCLSFRKKHKDVFVYGGFEILDPQNRDVVAFRRFSKDECYVTVTNFTGKYLEWSGLGDHKVEEWVIGNHPLGPHNDNLGGTLYLRPWEGIIGRCSEVHP